MKACYDLKTSPPTYDVVAFLLLAEAERIRRGEKYLEIHILPGPRGGFRDDALWPDSIHERHKLLNNIVLPMCEMLPSVEMLKVHATRPPELMQEFGAGDYLISLGAIVKGLGQGRPLRPRQELPVVPNLVTITLREADHWPLRNSRLEQWLEAASLMMDAGWDVWIIRDTLRADTPLLGLQHATRPMTIVPAASRELHQRASLYSRAVVNLGVSNGPMWLAAALNAPMIMMRPTTEHAGGPFDNAFFTEYGLPPGSQLPGSLTHQRLVWKDDTTENIWDAFADMLGAVS